MLLSIIIPVYNLPQKLLQECINSILAIGLEQSTYEIIIVDDGSAEQIRWIKTNYPANNIKLIEQPNSGPGGARNTGIETAQGKYIQFVDGDDTLTNHQASKQCLALLEKESPDILRFKHQRGINARQKKVRFGNTISGALFMKNNNLPAGVWCYYIKRELLIRKNIRFSTNIYHEDEEFSTIVHYHAKTLIESNALIYNYRKRKDSITENRKQEEVEKRLSNRLTITSRLATFSATMAEQSNTIQKQALQRKLSTLAVDAIINNMQAGKSAEETYQMCRNELTPLTLYPIQGDYGIKFNIFKKLANSPIGLTILRYIIPTKR